MGRLLIVLIVGVRISLAAQADAAATQKTSAAATTNSKTNSAAVMAKQTGASVAMLASVERQKAASQSQVGTGGPAAPFFTNPWIGPQEIPIPDIVPVCDPMPEADLKALIAEAAKAQDVKADLIRAVIRHESASYPCAISEKGAVGLMQLMPDVAQQFNADPLDPKQNIQAGTQYLKQLLSHYKGDVRLAVAAYNAGPQRVDAGNKVPPIPETASYVDAVLKDLNPSPSSPQQ